MARRATTYDDVRDGPLERLLLRSGRGDTEAFAELYDALAPRVFGLVTCLVRDAAASEAITCEVFVEAWRRSSTYDPARASAAAWTLLLTHRLAVRTRRLSAPATDQAASACADDSVLLAAGLSRAQADAVHLAYFAGLDHRRISASVDSDEPVSTLIADGLEVLALASLGDETKRYRDG